MVIGRDGGEGGIRTPDTLSGTHAFQARALSRSATSPFSKGFLIVASFLLQGKFFVKRNDRMDGGKKEKCNLLEKMVLYLRVVGGEERRRCGDYSNASRYI